MQRCKLLRIQTILPKVMRPTRAVGGMRLNDSCRDSCQPYTHTEKQRGGERREERDVSEPVGMWGTVP